MSSVCQSDCLSVCPSVTLVDCDHIGWNSSKIISRLVSLRCSLSADPNIGGLLQTPGNFGQNDPPRVNLSVGDIRSQIAAKWLQVGQRSQCRAYRKLPSLFLMVLSLIPYDLPFPPKCGFHMPPIYANGHISATGDPIYFMFGYRVGFFRDCGSNCAIYDSNKSKMAAAAILKKFQMAISPQRLTIYLYSAHRAVIFAIAQLSC